MRSLFCPFSAFPRVPPELVVGKKQLSDYAAATAALKHGGGSRKF